MTIQLSIKVTLPLRRDVNRSIAWDGEFCSNHAKEVKIMKIQSRLVDSIEQIEEVANRRFFPGQSCTHLFCIGLSYCYRADSENGKERLATKWVNHDCAGCIGYRRAEERFTQTNFKLNSFLLFNYRRPILKTPDVLPGHVMASERF